MEKSKVCIRRRWANKEVECLVRLNDEEIAIEINLVAFLDSLVEEMGSPAMTMTKAGLKERMLKALPAVELEFKRATNEVV